jgi:hypothetical protein
MPPAYRHIAGDPPQASCIHPMRTHRGGSISTPPPAVGFWATSSGAANGGHRTPNAGMLAHSKLPAAGWPRLTQSCAGWCAGVAKTAMEAQVQLAAEHYGFTYVILRAGPLFGPGSQTTSSISEFTQLILQVGGPFCRCSGTKLAHCILHVLLVRVCRWGVSVSLHVWVR